LNKSKTLVLIDDSGDAGFKLDRGSSRFFVIAAIIFHDLLESEKTAVAIKELRRRHRFPDTMEYKFNKSRRQVRVDFLRTAAPFGFTVRALVVDKALIRSTELKNDKNSFYGYMIKTLLKHSDKSIVNAKVKIDGSGDRSFRRSFKTYLRRYLNTHKCKVMQDCKLVDSREDVLIQMADMVAGSIHRSYQDKKDKDVYCSIISRHIEDTWNFK